MLSQQPGMSPWVQTNQPWAWRALARLWPCLSRAEHARTSSMRRSRASELKSKYIIFPLLFN